MAYVANCIRGYWFHIYNINDIAINFSELWFETKNMKIEYNQLWKTVCVESYLYANLNSQNTFEMRLTSITHDIDGGVYLEFNSVNPDGVHHDSLIFSYESNSNRKLGNWIMIEGDDDLFKRPDKLPQSMALYLDFIVGETSARHRKEYKNERSPTG